MRFFDNFVGIKTSKKDAHYFFHYIGGCKIVSDAPESNRDWKERFVWVFGTDAILSCPTWPEIKKDALRPQVLSVEERRHFEKIRSYAGSREMSNLFEPASLRVAGISRVPPFEADNVRAALLALPLKKNPLTNLRGEDSASAGPVSTSRPQKRLRGEVAPEEVDSLRSRAAEVVAKLAGPSAAANKEKLDKKRRRLDRGQGPKGTFGSVVAPPPQQSEVIIIDEASPPKHAEGDQAAEVAEAEAQARGLSSQAPLLEPTQRPGKEPV